MTEKIPMIADVRAAAAALPPFVMDTAMGPQLAKECAARLSHFWEMDPASSPTVLTGITSSQKALALSAAMQSFGTAIVGKKISLSSCRRRLFIPFHSSKRLAFR